MRVRVLGPFVAPPAPLRRPLFLARVAAGFPSPADDYVDRVLSLDEYVVQNATATYFVRVEGDSMRGAGIHDGDVLVVDCAREVESGDVVVAVLDGEITVKRVRVRSWRGRRPESLWLVPENEDFPLIAVTEGMAFEVWGVVVASVHLHARAHGRDGRGLVARAPARGGTGGSTHGPVHGDGRDGEPPGEPPAVG